MDSSDGAPACGKHTHLRYHIEGISFGSRANLVQVTKMVGSPGWWGNRT